MYELLDKVVMVHPTLTHDPVHMQGHMGTIYNLDVAKDEVLVKFKNQMIGLYSTDALLMLVPGEEILDKLRAHLHEEIDGQDVIDILGLYLLDATGELNYRKEALDLAMSRSNLMFATVVSVQDYIDVHRDLDPDYKPGRGR